MPRALVWIIAAVAVLVVTLAGLTAAVWITTQDRPKGALDTDLEGVTVSGGTTSTPQPTPAPEPTGDQRCWRTFGGDPQRTLARPFATLGLPARTILWTRGLESYIEFPPVYCEGELYVNSSAAPVATCGRCRLPGKSNPRPSSSTARSTSARTTVGFSRCARTPAASSGPTTPGGASTRARPSSVGVYASPPTRARSY